MDPADYLRDFLLMLHFDCSSRQGGISAGKGSLTIHVVCSPKRLYTFCDPQRSFEVSWLVCARACTQILMLTRSALCRPSHRPSLLAIHFYVRDQGGRPAPHYLPTPSFASAPQFTSYFLKQWTRQERQKQYRCRTLH